MRRDIYTATTAAKAVVTELDLAGDGRVVDLGCGDGVFMEAALAVHGPSVVREIVGIELEEPAVLAARERLRKSGFPPEVWRVIHGDALETPISNVKAVIGNPPWIRLHDISAAYRKSYRARFASARGAFDLCYLFIEHSISLLRPGGQLALVVPWGIDSQPAAAGIRRVMSTDGAYRMTRLPPSTLAKPAGVDVGLLTFTKGASHRNQTPEPLVLGDIARVTTGTSSGADPIFMSGAGEVGSSDWVRPALRGRDVATGRTSSIIFPYRDEPEGRRSLRPLSDDLASRYLQSRREELLSRRRFQRQFAAHPDVFYRFIDSGRPPIAGGARIAVPDIWREPTWTRPSHDTVVMNTCFEVHPYEGCEGRVEEVLQDERFWRQWANRSRRMASDFVRSSVGEMRSLPIT